MNRFSQKLPIKGFMAVLGIVVAVVLLFAIFGRNPGYDLQKSTPQVAISEVSGINLTANKIMAEAPEAPARMYGTTNDAAYESGMGYNQESVKLELSEEMDGASLPDDRKIIKEGSAYIETTDFDHSINAIDKLITKAGGFYERKNINGNGYSSYDLRNASIVFRVPANEFEAIMESMGTVGVVTQSNTSGTNITDQYIDYETRVRNLKAQEETLLDILSKAEKLEDVITLESRIYEVRYEIESIENKLKNFDRLVQYSRISVNLSEVVETTRQDPVPRTLGDRLTAAFGSAIDSFINGLENFMVWLVYNWILLAVILVLLIAFIIVFSTIRKRRKREAPVVVECGTPHNDSQKDSESTDK